MLIWIQTYVVVKSDLLCETVFIQFFGTSIAVFKMTFMDIIIERLIIMEMCNQNNMKYTCFFTTLEELQYICERTE